MDAPGRTRLWDDRQILTFLRQTIENQHLVRRQGQFRQLLERSPARPFHHRLISQSEGVHACTAQHHDSFPHNGFQHAFNVVIALGGSLAAQRMTVYQQSDWELPKAAARHALKIPIDHPAFKEMSTEAP